MLLIPYRVYVQVLAIWVNIGNIAIYYLLYVNICSTEYQGDRILDALVL